MFNTDGRIGGVPRGVGSQGEGRGWDASRFAGDAQRPSSSCGPKTLASSLTAFPPWHGAMLSRCHLPMPSASVPSSSRARPPVDEECEEIRRASIVVGHDAVGGGG